MEWLILGYNPTSMGSRGQILSPFCVCPHPTPANATKFTYQLHSYQIWYSHTAWRDEVFLLGQPCHHPKRSSISKIICNSLLFIHTHGFTYRDQIRHSKQVNLGKVLMLFTVKHGTIGERQGTGAPKLSGPTT